MDPMDMRTRLNEALKMAMKQKDAARLSTLRLITAAIKDRDIAKRGEGEEAEVSEAEILAILGKMVKQRQESARVYEEGGRLELAEKELGEVTIIEEFLPRQLSDEEVAAAIDAAVDALKAIDAEAAADIVHRALMAFRQMLDERPELVERMEAGDDDVMDEYLDMLAHPGLVELSDAFFKVAPYLADKRLAFIRAKSTSSSWSNRPDVKRASIHTLGCRLNQSESTLLSEHLRAAGYTIVPFGEDADLGIRLARHGYRTELMDTVTKEEANCKPWPWIKQRSRWIKGYAMTWGVHMRNPRRLYRELGLRKFLGVQFLFLGTLSQFVLAPVLWSFWLLAFGLPHPLQAVLPGWSFWGLGITFFLAELLTIAVGMMAVADAEHRFLVKWVPTLHVYWPLASIAAIKVENWPASTATSSTVAASAASVCSPAC